MYVDRRWFGNWNGVCTYPQNETNQEDRRGRAGSDHRQGMVSAYVAIYASGIQGWRAGMTIEDSTQTEGLVLDDPTSSSSTGGEVPTCCLSAPKKSNVLGRQVEYTCRRRDFLRESVHRFRRVCQPARGSFSRECEGCRAPVRASGGFTTAAPPCCPRWGGVSPTTVVVCFSLFSALRVLLAVIPSTEICTLCEIRTAEASPGGERITTERCVVRLCPPRRTCSSIKKSGSEEHQLNTSQHQAS